MWWLIWTRRAALGFTPCHLGFSSYPFPPPRLTFGYRHGLAADRGTASFWTSHFVLISVTAGGTKIVTKSGRRKG
jgi:hypothetical protein